MHCSCCTGFETLPFSQLVCRLAASGAALLCPEFAQVSLRIVREVPQASELAARVVGMMDRLRMGKVSVWGLRIWNSWCNFELCMCSLTSFSGLEEGCPGPVGWQRVWWARRDPLRMGTVGSFEFESCT